MAKSLFEIINQAKRIADKSKSRLQKAQQSINTMADRHTAEGITFSDQAAAERERAGKYWSDVDRTKYLANNAISGLGPDASYSGSRWMKNCLDSGSPNCMDTWRKGEFLNHIPTEEDIMMDPGMYLDHSNPVIRKYAEAVANGDIGF